MDVQNDVMKILRINAPRLSTLVVLLLMSALVLAAENIQTSSSPCQEDPDPIYGGIRITCTSQSIISLPLPERWIPRGTTTLLLDNNQIRCLDNNSFSLSDVWTKLRYLSLSYNHITSIENFAFANLANLEKINLTHNAINLDNKSLSGHVFGGLTQLVDLDLTNNGNSAREGHYPDSLLDGLHNLRILSLDTFEGKLDFGQLFHGITNLSSLVLSGGLTTITNNSFKDLRSVGLKTLSIIPGNHLYFTDTGSFQYLDSLDCLIKSHTFQAISISMDSLAPLVGSRMNALEILNPHVHAYLASGFVRNSILTKSLTKYLSRICVKRFSLTNGKIYVIENGVLTNPIWRKCLKYLDLSGNPVIADRRIVYEMPNMNILENVQFNGAKYAQAGSYQTTWKPTPCDNWKHTQQKSNLKRNSYLYVNNSSKCSIDPFSNCSMREMKYLQGLGGLLINEQIQTPQSVKLHFNQLNPKRSPGVTILFPKHLRVIAANAVVTYMGDVHLNINLLGAECLEQVHISDNGLKIFIGKIRGLPKILLLDISLNDGSVMSPSFFDTMPSLRYLNMAGMMLDKEFMTEYSGRLFQSLRLLKNLDLSGNSLSFMSNDTFAKNDQLSVLVLAGNRFASLPFQLQYLPNLCWLDLRTNFFREISGQDIQSLETHFQDIKSFSLNLDGNEFYCGCNNIRFLSWLQRTRIHLDKKGDYPCISDSGVQSTTGQIKDLKAMWRKCNGQNIFWLSLVLLCLMLIGFLCCILASRFQTQIKAFIMRLFWAPFVMKTSADYPIGVYIGYADHDTNMACQKLRPFIENQLGLSTYVRHRDLLPASDVSEAIMEAVNCSWRVLLLISHHFLDDPWSYYLLKVSTYAVQAENPGRIVVILLTNGDNDDNVLARLPSSLLRAVQEKSIVMMSTHGNISYENFEAMRTSLLYYYPS